MLIRSLIGLFICASATCFAGDESRPNVLWVIAEDLCPDFACYGNSDVTTPNIDRFAAEGVMYTNAHATAPVCSPSRSALITGRYQTSIGAHHHRSHRTDGFQLAEHIRLLPEMLRDAGYFNVKITEVPESLPLKLHGIRRAGQ